MRTFLRVLSVVLVTFNLSFSQPDELFLSSSEAEKEVIEGWVKNSEVGLYLNQVSFTNWNAGGTNSISAIASGKFNADYSNENLFWKSSITSRYGINKQEGESLRKTEDVISLISNFGYQKNTLSNWFYSARFSFNTQYAKGFNYPNTDTPISKFMAPGYLFFGVGFEYGKQIENLSFYASPFTLKATFVLDRDLANAGAFGVDPAIFDEEGNIVKEGSKTRGELGILLTHQLQKEIAENIKVSSLLRLYTDYLNNFGNVDLEWEVNFDFKVNKYVQAMLGSHLRYDDDIKTEVVKNEMTNEEIVVEGPKLQWKQLLGVGVVVNLSELEFFKTK